MQHLQYGINSRSKFAIAHRLPLLRGTFGAYYFPVPSLRRAPRHLSIGVNATGDAGDASPPIFGQPGTKYLISPAKFVKFLLSHAKRMAVNLLGSMNTGVVLRLTQTH